MWFLALFLVPLLVNTADAISACGVCGEKSGVLCHDDTTFSFCNKDKTPRPGRHSCPTGMVCIDSFSICANSSTIPEGTTRCETKCGNCINGRYTCVTPTTFSLCFGSDKPSGAIYKCPTNKICSTTADPTSTDFCFNPVRLHDEHIDCFEPPATAASSVFARFVAAAPPAPVE